MAKARATAASTADKTKCTVLDIETRPDKFARVLASEKMASRSSMLVEIANASILEFDRDQHGLVSHFCLSSFHEDEFAEADIVLNVSSSVAKSVRSGGTVVTYNGSRFDLPMLRLRQLRWWVSSNIELRSLLKRSDNHVDVMTAISMGLGSPPKLRDACAMVGFSITGPIRLHDAKAAPAQQVKCETDVIATTILYFYLMAERSDRPDALAENLGRLGCYLRRAGKGRAHLERFGFDPLLGDEPRPWTTTNPDGTNADVSARPRRGRPPILC